jgi:hypothetical protein
MTTLHEQAKKTAEAKHNTMKLADAMTDSAAGRERRKHRRHDLAMQGIPVDRWDNKRRVGKSFGEIVDISAGGVRIRTSAADVRPDGQIRLRLELPDYAGISPFIATDGEKMEAKREWIGWMTVSRVQKIDSTRMDIAGQLVDMTEMDRGMLGLYLSTQPLAA